MPSNHTSVRLLTHQQQSDLLLVLLNLLGVQRVERLDSELEVGDERVAARLCKVLAHDDAQHLHLLRVWGHGVGGDYPAALTELMGTVDIVSKTPC